MNNKSVLRKMSGVSRLLSVLCLLSRMNEKYERATVLDLQNFMKHALVSISPCKALVMYYNNGDIFFFCF
jgi:hypothetical protein